MDGIDNKEILFVQKLETPKCEVFIKNCRGIFYS